MSLVQREDLLAPVARLDVETVHLSGRRSGACGRASRRDAIDFGEFVCGEFHGGTMSQLCP